MRGLGVLPTGCIWVCLFTLEAGLGPQQDVTACLPWNIQKKKKKKKIKRLDISAFIFAWVKRRGV
jgi:hypothetical protein